MKKNKLLIIACSYTFSAKKLVDQLQASFHNFELSGVIVSNSEKQENVSIDGFSILRGTNVLFEFSAYNEGVKELLKQEQDIAHYPILILNDTLFLKHNSKFILNKIITYYDAIIRVSIPAMAGRLDAYNNICYANPWNNITGYISSFCMLVNREGAQQISDCYNMLPEYFSEEITDINDPLWGGGVDVSLKEFIRSHLLDIDSETAWYQAKINAANFMRLHNKGKCVFMEHFISGEIGRKGILISIIPTWKGKISHFIYEQISKLQRKLTIR